MAASGKTRQQDSGGTISDRTTKNGKIIQLNLALVGVILKMKPVDEKSDPFEIANSFTQYPLA